MVGVRSSGGPGPEAKVYDALASVLEDPKTFRANLKALQEQTHALEIARAAAEDAQTKAAQRIAEAEKRFRDAEAREAAFRVEQEKFQKIQREADEDWSRRNTRFDSLVEDLEKRKSDLAEREKVVTKRELDAATTMRALDARATEVEMAEKRAGRLSEACDRFLREIR